MLDEFTISSFRTQLEQRRDQLLQLAKEKAVEARMLGSDGPLDIGDESQFHYLKEQLSLQGNRSREILSAVEAALERIIQKTFGVCIHCGGEIQIRRLHVVPWAERCVKCQQELESQHRAAA